MTMTPKLKKLRVQSYKQLRDLLSLHSLSYRHAQRSLKEASEERCCISHWDRQGWIRSVNCALSPL